MKFKLRLLTTLATAAIFCGSVNARGILIDNWQATGDGGTTNSVVVNPAAIPLGFSLTGVTSLGFSPGNDISGYSVATISDLNLTEYAFGGSVTVPQEQITILPFGVSSGPASQFLVDFNYDGADGFGALGQTASLSINGVTYTTKAGVAPSQLSEAAGEFNFKNGVLQNSAVIATAWTKSGGGTITAPEIDPASATSALTLLAGSLAIVLGSKRRKIASHAA